MAAASLVRSIETIMEALFRPSTRFLGLPDDFTEVELLPGLTVVDNVLATGVTWEDFCLFLQGKGVWMAPNVYVCCRSFYGSESVFSLGCLGHTYLCVCVTPDAAAAAATATCNFLVRLLATCEHHDVYIGGCSSGASTPLSGAALSLFFQESRDSLRKVAFHDMALNEDQCRALATMSRLDVEVKLRYCTLVDDAAEAFVECLQSDRGPVKLQNCRIDNRILASALTGNSRVTKLKLYYRRTDYRRTIDADMAILFAALANNRGLVDLDLCNIPTSNENWSALCESLKAHPTLTCLDLRSTSPRHPIGNRIVLTDDQKLHRTRLLAEMVQHNTVLHTIQLSEDERDEEIYTEEILPRLETNLYRPRVLAVKKTKEITFREKVLGRALFSVNSSPNLVWMFLSENVDAFARTEEEHETTSIEVPVVVVSAAAVAGTKRKL
jgi:hypothetical protein